MDNTFGQLLRDCRRMADLTQKELGRAVNIDPSMISRFETGGSIPNPSTLQRIINALALYEVPREKLDRLWPAAGYPGPRLPDTPTIDPVVAFIHGELERLEPGSRALLSEDLRSTVEINQMYVSAKEYAEERKWRSAIEMLVPLRSRLEQRVQRWFLRVDEELGKCYYSEGSYAEAIQCFESALWSTWQSNDRRKQGEILIRLGDAHRRRGGPEWKVARERYEAAEAIFRELGDQRQVAVCKRKIAGVCLFQGLPNEALPFCEESLAICRQEGYERGIYKALQIKAWAYDMLGRWEEATRLYEEALEILPRITSDEWEHLKALRYLADAYRLERRVDEAEKTYREALAIVERLEKAGFEAKLLSGMIRLGLGQVYLKMRGRELEAKEYLNRSLEEHRGLGEDFRVAQVLIEQGTLLMRLGRLGEAEARLRQAGDRLKRLGNIYHYCNALSTLCELYYEKGDYEAVYRTAEDAREVDNGLVDYHLSRIELIVGKSLIRQKRYKEASAALSRAAKRALRFNDQSFLEVHGELLDEIDTIAHKVGPEVALRLCESYRKSWESEDLSPREREAVQVSLKAIWRKQKEIEALLPIVEEQE